MKKLLILVFVTLTLQLSAQHYVSLYPLLQYSKLGSPSFDTFLASYGQYNSQYISLLPSGTQAGLGYGVGVRAVMYGHLLIPIEISQMNSSAKVEFNDGSSRDFKFRSAGVTMGLGYALQEVSKPFYLYPELGIFLERDQIKSSFMEGTGSFNPAALNGKFTAAGGKFFVGLGAAAGTSSIKGFARFQYFFPIASSQLEDKDKVLNDYGSHIIPIDYPQWAYDPVNYIGDGVEDDFKGLNISFGIVFDIKMKEE